MTEESTNSKVSSSEVHPVDMQLTSQLSKAILSAAKKLKDNFF